MMQGERRVLIAEKAAVIREALSILASSAELEGNVSSGIREALQALREGNYDSMILELRAEERAEGDTSPAVRNIRISHMGHILVASVEITSPRILQQIAELHSPHFSPE